MMIIYFFISTLLCIAVAKEDESLSISGKIGWYLLAMTHFGAYIAEILRA